LRIGSEFFRRLQIVEILDRTASKIKIWAKKLFFFLGILGYIGLAALTTAPGIALRYAACHLQKEPFLHVKGKMQEKTLDQKKFSILSWNICGTSAGYSITDGGVMPWCFRIDSLIKKIQEKNADVVCLYEVFDVNTAMRLSKQMEDKYAHFYFNMGIKSVGVSSGLFVASKFEMINPEFIAFPKEALVGRTKNCGKGFFAFDIQSKGKSFARIFSTHLQHSEECDYPTSEEKGARRKEMDMIIERVKHVKDKSIVVTGDFNLDDKEYAASSWQHLFEKGDHFGSSKTWGGDEFCASLTGKKTSPPLNLDHTMIKKGTAQSIHTSLVQTGYDAKRFKRDALSDHEGLYSEVIV